MGDLNAGCGTVAEFNDFDLSHVTADCYGIDDRTISFINNAHELCTNGIKSADKTKIILVVSFYNCVEIITCKYVTGVHVYALIHLLTQHAQKGVL